MKKFYIVPEMDIVQLRFTQHILSGSIPVKDNEEPVDAGDAAAPEYHYVEE